MNPPTDSGGTLHRLPGGQAAGSHPPAIAASTEE